MTYENPVHQNKIGAAQVHQKELFDDWQRAVSLEPLLRIPGADND